MRGRELLQVNQLLYVCVKDDITNYFAGLFTLSARKTTQFVSVVSKNTQWEDAWTCKNCPTQIAKVTQNISYHGPPKPISNYNVRKLKISKNRLVTYMSVLSGGP